MAGSSLRLGDTFPNMSVKTTKGQFKIHDWKGTSWMLFFSHPADFTPVCTTEIGELVRLESEFRKRDVKLLGLSCDSVEDHLKWTEDIFAYCAKSGGGCKGTDLPFPIVGDEERTVAKTLGMIDASEPVTKALPLTCRAVFIVGSDNLIKLFIYYPASTGRNFAELIRVVDSLQLTNQKKLATPANWNPGEKVMIAASANDDEAKRIDPNYEKVELPSKKNYIRMANVN